MMNSNDGEVICEYRREKGMEEMVSDSCSPVTNVTMFWKTHLVTIYRGSRGGHRAASKSPISRRSFAE